MPSIRARILTPQTTENAQFFEDGFLQWTEDGILERVETYTGQAVDKDIFPSLITPGFVDGHIHFPQTRIVGSASGPLLPWLETSVFPEEARFANEPHAHEVAAIFVENLLKSGTTYSLVYGSVHPSATDILLGKAAEVGLRMTAGPVLMDSHCPQELQLAAEPAMNGLRALAERWNGHDGRIHVAVIPRFALSCSTEMMRAASQVAEDLDLWVSTHLSENPVECAIARERFGTTDYLQVYEDLGLVHEKSVYAHCIHLSESELDRLAARGAVVAHCPDSNFFLGSGNMPIASILERGIPVCIGSDIAAGRSFSIPKNASAVYDNALMVGYSIRPETLLWLATAGGAQSLGQQGLGKLEAGYKADFVQFDPPSWVKTSESSLAWLLLNRDLPSATSVWVNGRKLTF